MKNHKLGRPTYNENYILTHLQRSIIVGMLLTDGWISHPPANTMPLVGFQNCNANLELVNYLMHVLEPIVRQKQPSPRRRGAPGSQDKLFLQWTFRTVAHPQLVQFEKAFGGAGKDKTIPTVSYLVQHLTWESLAVIIMCDGSIKGKGRGMEIHLQGFESQIALGRLCIALYYRFGIKAFPSYYGLSKTSGEKQYHIQISGFSLSVLHKKLSQHILPTFRYKIPSMGTRKTTNCVGSPWWGWYRSAKEANWLETLEQ